MYTVVMNVNVFFCVDAKLVHGIPLDYFPRKGKGKKKSSLNVLESNLKKNGSGSREEAFVLIKGIHFIPLLSENINIVLSMGFFFLNGSCFQFDKKEKVEQITVIFVCWQCNYAHCESCW